MIHPRGVVYLLLSIILLALAYATMGGNIKMATVVTALPVGVIIILAGVQYPMLSFTLFCIFACYLHAISRYTKMEGVSVILDICLLICVLSIIMNITSRNPTLNLRWKNAFNVLSVGQMFWVLFVLFEFFFPYTHFEDPVKTRGVFLSIPLTYILCGLLLDTPRKLRMTLVFLAIFVFTAWVKLYWQKYHGFDPTECRFLFVEGGSRTHILNNGIRYFSFFSDAGNFGGFMGAACMLFLIPSFVVRRWWLRLICIAATIMATIGLFMSGTRGAIVIPFGGLVAFVFLSKNSTAIVSTIIGGVLAFCFFYFTDIGDGNSFIRRIRTAFRPQEDASFNVRVENQKRIAVYLADKPFGLGLGSPVIDSKGLMDKGMKFEQYADPNQRLGMHTIIPPDSYFVQIWIYHGIVGLVSFLLFWCIVIVRCCYILLFKVRHSQLRLVLAGMVGVVVGLLANSYVGEVMGAYPSSLLVAICLSFALNGSYIDKQLRPDENI